jgi:hypothetical protein
MINVIKRDFVPVSFVQYHAWLVEENLEKFDLLKRNSIKEYEQWRKLQQQLLHCSVGINLSGDSVVDLIGVLGFNCFSK